MSDRPRNRFAAAIGRLEVSKIFEWHGADFNLGHHDITSLAEFMTRYADSLDDSLADSQVDRERVRGQRAEITFLPYAWPFDESS